MKASEWIDRVKRERGWESDYRVAKELGFRPSTISQYRSHGGTLDDGIALKVASALGERPELILLDQVVERSKNEPARSALARVLAHISGAKPGRGTGAHAAANAAPVDIRKPDSSGIHIASNRPDQVKKSPLARVAATLQNLIPSAPQGLAVAA